MKKRISVLLLVFIMLLSIPVWAGTQGQDQIKLQGQDEIREQISLLNQDQTQDQTRLRDQDQLRLDQEAQDQVRLRLWEQLQISDAARTQLQERLQLMEQTGEGIFGDTQQHWAREQIASAYQWGFTNGYQDGTFRPNGTISGVEGILMMSRMMNCMNIAGESDAEGTEIDLNEVPAWAREMIQEETAMSIATQSKFYGEEQLNRLQFAVLLAKALKLDPMPDSGINGNFLDQESMPAEDLGYVNALRILGVVEGSGGFFHPDQAVSRAEAVCMLARVMDVID